MSTRSCNEDPSSVQESAVLACTTIESLQAATEPDDRKRLQDYYGSLNFVAAARLRDRNVNTKVEYPEETFYSTLDSKLKSCTGYIKKLKNLTESQHDILEKDFQGTFQQYLGILCYY
jgi:hypothetical protein